MKTYIAQISFSASAGVAEVTNQMPGPVTIIPDTQVGVWWIECTGAFANTTTIICTPMANEVDAGPNQYINASPFNTDKCFVRFGNGEEHQAPNASPYRLEINVAE